MLVVLFVNVVFVEVMFKIFGIDCFKVNIVFYVYDLILFIKGEIDVLFDFIINVFFIIKQVGEEVVFFLFYDYGFKIFNDIVVVIEEMFKMKCKEIVVFFKVSCKGWVENLKDLVVYFKQFVDIWYKGIGCLIENEVYFNIVQKFLIESLKGIFLMSEEVIVVNIELFVVVGIKVK